MRFSYFLGAGALFVGSVALTGCNWGGADAIGEEAARRVLESKLEKKKQKDGTLGTVVSSGSELLGRDAQGRVLWKVGSQEIVAREEKTDENGKIIAPRQADLKEANAALFRAGALHSSFRAPQLQLTWAQKGVLMAMSGGVKMQTKALAASGRVLSNAPVQVNAPRLDVDINAKQLNAMQGIVMTQEKTRLTAKTLRADSEMTLAQLAGGITATSNGSTIRAQNAQWNWKAKRVQATGGVQVQRDAMTLRGETLNADLGAQRGQLQPAKGARVLAVSRDGQADAGRLNYDWGKGVVQAGGGVNFRKDGATMSAASLHSDDKFARATASGEVRFQKDGAILRAHSVTAFDKMSRAVAEGGATLEKDGATVRAASLSASENFTRATASGGVTFFKDGTTMRAASVTAFDKFTRATAEGEVQMQRGDVSLRAAGIEAFLPQRHVVARGGVVIERPDATIRARTAQAWLESGKVTGSDVHLRRADGSTMEAAQMNISGAQNSATARVLASGGVTARSSRGVVRAPRVTWQGAGARGKGRVLAEGGVVLQSEGSTLRGAKLESDDAFQSAVLTGNVGGTLKGTTSFSAGSLQKRGDRVLAEGGVNARNKDMMLRADRMEASADGMHATLRGNVLLTTADGVTVSAPMARYDRRQNKVFANGGVVIRDPRRGEQRTDTIVAELGERGFKKITTGKVRGTFRGDVNNVFRGR